MATWSTYAERVGTLPDFANSSQALVGHVVSRHFIVFDTMLQIPVNLSFWASGLASADIFLALIDIVDDNSNMLVVGAVTFNLSFPCQPFEVYRHC